MLVKTDATFSATAAVSSAAISPGLSWSCSSTGLAMAMSDGRKTVR